jgi:hypothetical protein
MRRSKRTNTLVLVANHTKAIYDDIWQDGVLNYTGMGQYGDQSLHGNQNITLFESETNDIEIHLFEVFKKKSYTYKGQVKLAEKPYQKIQHDLFNRKRTVWIFPLKSIDETINSDYDKHNISKPDEKIALSPAIKSEEFQIPHEDSNDKDLDLFEWSVRARNCLKASNIKTITELAELSEFELLSIPNLGKGSLLEIKKNLAKFNLKIGERTSSNQPIFKKTAFQDITLKNLEKKTLDIAVVSLIPSLSARSVNCLESMTLGQLLSMTKYELLRVPNLGKLTLNEIKKGLVNLSPIKTDEYIIDDSSLENYLNSIKNHLKSERDFQVFANRIGLFEKDKTLEEISETYGVTRERIRQIELKVRKNIKVIELVNLIEHKLFSIRKNLLMPLYVDQISNYDHFFSILDTRPWILAELLIINSNISHKVETIEGQSIVSIGGKSILANAIEHLKTHLQNLIGESYSKKDLKDYISLRYPLMAKEISNFLISKLDNFKFTLGNDDSESFLVSEGLGKFAEVIAILQSFDAPITRKKLTKELNLRGISTTRSVLNQITGKYGKENDVYVFGRSLYGLRRHLNFSDIEIELINEKIYYFMLQENIDRQWTCQELLQQVQFTNSIKNKIDKYKLSIAMMQSDNFIYVGQLVFVHKNSNNTKVEKKDFSLMVKEVLKKSPEPLSAIDLRNIIKKEMSIPGTGQIHPSGQLISIRPYPVAPKGSIKWCLIGKHLKISKIQLEIIIKEMQILIKANGLSLNPEQCIDLIKNNSVLKDFQEDILTLFTLSNKNICFILRDNVLYHTEAKLTNLSARDCMKIAASKIGENGIKSDTLFNQIQALYGKKPTHNVLSNLYRFGFIFSKDTNTWHRGEVVEY